jgi:hypothetical protein
MAAEIARVKAEMEQNEPAEKPTIIEHEIDKSIQTGDPALLGGAISIHAHYRKTDIMVDPWQ